MRILFLDIDGVCNHAHTRERHGGFIGINPAKAELVRSIVKATGCRVVLSSVWRLEKHTLKHVEAKVTPVMDITPHYPGKPRGCEVQAWLDKHPEVDKYAILDDDGDFLPGQNLFQTTWKKGLTPEITEAVIDHLNSV